MKRKIITTGDGSKTIHIEEWDEQYHSKHGAINEANHVFIKNGLHYFLNCLINESHVKPFDYAQDKLHRKVSILEIGFGTGLNAFLTSLEAQKLDLEIDYVGVEAYPVLKDEIAELNYVQQINSSKSDLFSILHEISWEEKQEISPNFSLTKRQQFFADINDKEKFDLIYFDAFGCRVQPELWTKEIFRLMYDALLPNGVLVTYAAIGQVKRDLNSLGFTVERLPGPPGKRHMLRATK